MSNNLSKLLGDYRFWVGIAITAYVTLAAAYPTLWKLPWSWLTAFFASSWQLLTGTYGIPGWAWILMCIVIAGALWITAILARSSVSHSSQPTTSRAAQPNSQIPNSNPAPTATTMFGVQLRWRYVQGRDELLVADPQVICSPCQMNLRQEFGHWHCIGCGRRYSDVPTRDDEIVSHIVGWLRRNYLR